MSMCAVLELSFEHRDDDKEPAQKTVDRHCVHTLSKASLVANAGIPRIGGNPDMHSPADPMSVSGRRLRSWAVTRQITSSAATTRRLRQDLTPASGFSRMPTGCLACSVIRGCRPRPVLGRQVTSMRGFWRWPSPWALSASPHGTCSFDAYVSNDPMLANVSVTPRCCVEPCDSQPRARRERWGRYSKCRPPLLVWRLDHVHLSCSLSDRHPCGLGRCVLDDTE